MSLAAAPFLSQLISVAILVGYAASLSGALTISSLISMPMSSAGFARSGIPVKALAPNKLAARDKVNVLFAITFAFFFLFFIVPPFK